MNADSDAHMCLEKAKLIDAVLCATGSLDCRGGNATSLLCPSKAACCMSSNLRDLRQALASTLQFTLNMFVLDTRRYFISV